MSSTGQKVRRSEGPKVRNVSINRKSVTDYYLLPTYYLPTAYYLLPTDYYLLPTYYYLRHTHDPLLVRYPVVWGTSTAR